MATSTMQIVPPNQRRWETILVAIALVAMVATTGGYVRTYGLEEKPQEILDWQISAFSGLQGVDQAIYNELIVAADEVNWLVYYNGTWPDDAEFQDSLLAPFYRDLSWEHNGSLKWTLKNVIQEGEAQGLTLYHGGGGTIETQGAFLLVIDHKHAGNSQITASNIWWHPKRDAPVPETSKVASLILHGWKQVIPYQGIDELERLNAN